MHKASVDQHGIAVLTENGRFVYSQISGYKSKLLFWYETQLIHLPSMYYNVYKLFISIMAIYDVHKRIY